MQKNKCDIGTLASEFSSKHEIENPNVVKVVVKEKLLKFYLKFDDPSAISSSGFGYDFSSCYDCGYTIESIVNLDKIPKRLQGVLSEEAMAFYGAPENRETTIWMETV